MSNPEFNPKALEVSSSEIGLASYEELYWGTEHATVSETNGPQGLPTGNCSPLPAARDKNSANHTAEADRFRSREIVVDVDSSSQLWCRKHRNVLVFSVLLIVSVSLSSIGIRFVAGSGSREQQINNDVNVVGSSMGDDDDGDASEEDHIHIEIEHNNGSDSPTNAPARFRRTNAPSQYPSTQHPTDVPTIVPTINNGPLTFYAIGDVPYSDMEACLLPHELMKLSPSEGRFLVHLGDIQDGRSNDCSESLHENIAEIFESSPLPTFFVIGDNGWLDCGVGNADESFTYWEKHLLPFHERTDLNWPELGTTVTRHPGHPEFFAFFVDNILFLGQGLPVAQPENMPDSDEWKKYLDANENWTREHFVLYAEQMRAAVIFSHSSGGPVVPYFEALKDIASSYAHVPILFLEDNHWFEDETFQDIPNFYRVALDDTITPVSITIDTDAMGENITDIFHYTRRCACSSDHRPTKLISYRSPGECRGACMSNNFCAGENVCGKDGDTC